MQSQNISTLCKDVSITVEQHGRHLLHEAEEIS